VLKGAAALQGGSSELLVLLAQAHAAQGEDQEAAGALEKALALDPGNAEARRARDDLEARRPRPRP
jgi:cytochrome c-type biogenesis protein CcmH/NrfG